MSNLKQLRQQYGLNQCQLAKLLKDSDLNISQHHISRWETGTIKLDHLKFRGIKAILKSKFSEVAISGPEVFYK